MNKYRLTSESFLSCFCCYCAVLRDSAVLKYIFNLSIEAIGSHPVGHDPFEGLLSDPFTGVAYDDQKTQIFTLLFITIAKLQL